MEAENILSEFIEVMHAIERHMEEDGQGAARLGQEAENYAFERHGCSKSDIEKGFAHIDSSEDIDPEIFRCFGAWFVYMRNGLRERGYLDG